MRKGTAATAAGVLQDQNFTQWKSGCSWATCHFFWKSGLYQPGLLQKQLQETGQVFIYYCQFLANLNPCLHVLVHSIFQVIFQNSWLLFFWTMTEKNKSRKCKHLGKMTAETINSQNISCWARTFFYLKSVCLSIRLIVWRDKGEGRNYSIACTSN